MKQGWMCIPSKSIVQGGNVEELSTVTREQLSIVHGLPSLQFTGSFYKKSSGETEERKNYALKSYNSQDRSCKITTHELLTQLDT